MMSTKPKLTITSVEVKILAAQTYQFIHSQFNMTDDDVKYVLQTLTNLIDNDKKLRG